MSHQADQNIRPDFDKELQAIADYVIDYQIESEEAYRTAYYCLLDTLGCGLMALQFSECRKVLGPIVPGMTLDNGARVPGCDYELDPVQAAFNIGTMVRWLDFNDTWLAAEWGHPSDNLGAILAVADYLARQGKQSFTVKDILTAMIKAHEIQGVLALQNSFNRVGLDHVVLVKVASTAVATHMLGGTRDDILNALAQAFVDGQSLRTYRHAPNAGSRKSWAAGDATSRAVRLALITLTGEKSCPSVLTAKTWGFYDVLFKGKAFKFERPYQSYVMEQILFKISYPAEFHSQTAVEAAIQLHSQIEDRLDEIEKIELKTHESAIRIISKEGPLHNPADRDHCLQYMVAIGLLFGELNATHYENAVADDPRIDALREKMHVSEDKQFSEDYFDPDKRSIANTVQVHFKDGQKTDAVTIEYPLGHRRRREEGIPVLMNKFKQSLSDHYAPTQADSLYNICDDKETLSRMPIEDFLSLFKKSSA